MNKLFLTYLIVNWIREKKNHPLIFMRQSKDINFTEKSDKQIAFNVLLIIHFKIVFKFILNFNFKKKFYSLEKFYSLKVLIEQ